MSMVPLGLPSVRLHVYGLSTLLDEGARRALWRLKLHEDVNKIRSGNQITMAEQELRNIEDYITCASFIFAKETNDSNKQTLCKWIMKFQKAVFCLDDQVDMYRIQGMDVLDLIAMKKAIGQLSIKELTSVITKCIRDKPDEVQKCDSISSEVLALICEPPIKPHEPKTEIVEIMENTFKELKGHLLAENKHSVIFVTGGKDSGKTMLMSRLFEDNKVEETFSKRKCWADAEKYTDLASFLRELRPVEDREPNNNDDTDGLLMVPKILNSFKGKNYLIVLDHVEDTRALDTLWHLPLERKGKTKIICLTRRHDIQEIVPEDIKEASISVPIPSLGDDDALKLFMHAAFSCKSLSTTDRDTEFRKAILMRAEENRLDKLAAADLKIKMDILDQALNKCMNNPRSIREVGNIFAGTQFEDWEAIQMQLNDVVTTLQEGYQRMEKLGPLIRQEEPILSHGDWRSFLYCLAFPEWTKIPAQKLLRLWIAEGFVQASPLHSQEHEAERLLQNLISKKLLVVKKRYCFDGKVLECSVNEHIRRMALDMCELQKLCRFVPLESNKPPRTDVAVDHPPVPMAAEDESAAYPTLSSRYRVLAVSGDEGVREGSKVLREDVRLRSLLYFEAGRVPLHTFKLSFKRKYRLLRTLELRGAPLESIPNSIRYLVCLRYLGLRNTQLKDLPDALKELKLLMCLDIRDTGITTLDDVSAFKKMRHLHLANSFRRQSVIIREGLQSLIYLRTLSGAAAGDTLGQELLHISFLTKLSVKASSASSKSICAAINAMMFLRSLAITVYDKELDGNKTKEKRTPPQGEEETTTSDDHGKQFDIRSLKVSENIRKLKLGGDMGKHSAHYIAMMHSITYLYLWDNKLDSDVLQTLQGLRNLLLLSLCNASKCCKLSSTHGGYRKLKKLSIINMEDLDECHFQNGSMKELEELVFAKCGKLVDSLQGLEDIESLKRVYVAEMKPSFTKRVKASKPKNAQVNPVSASQTMAPDEPIAPSATEGGGVTQTKTVDPFSPRGAHHTTLDTKSGDGATSAAGSSIPAPPTLASGKEQEIPPVQMDTGYCSDDENDSQIDTSGKTKAGSGYEAGQTSSMMESSRDFEQAKEHPAQDQSLAELPLEQQIKLAEFMSVTGLSPAEALGLVELPEPEKVETTNKWPFELGKPLVRPELVRNLSTKMHEFHQWYMKQSANKTTMFGLLVKPIYYFGDGEQVMWLRFKDIYEVYHQDALDVSLISVWVLMQIQRCEESNFNAGFMDPMLINKKKILESPGPTQQNIYKFLEKHKSKTYILLPYNFNFHWILFIIIVDSSKVIVLDSLRKPKEDYQEIQEYLNIVWKQFCKDHRGELKEMLEFKTDFPCLRQKQGNNLCGHYVCEHMYHFVKDKGLSGDMKMLSIRDELLGQDRILAIQQGLLRFLVDEVINSEGEFYYNENSIVEDSPPEDPKN